MYVATTPPRLTPRGSSAARTRRPYLRFAPLTRGAAEQAEDTNAASLSLTSVSQSFNPSPTSDTQRGKREEPQLITPSPPMGGDSKGRPPRRQMSERSSSISTSTCSTYDRRQSQYGQNCQRLSTPSPRSSILCSDISSSFNEEYRRQSATRCTVQPLSEDEGALVNAAYKKYVQSIDRPACLLILLQELGASDSLADCETWLQQLEKFLCISRDQLVGSSFSTTEGTAESDKTLGKHQRVLTEEEVNYFATWLKTTRGELFAPRATPTDTSIPVNGGKNTNTISSSLAATNSTSNTPATAKATVASTEKGKNSNRPSSNRSAQKDGSSERRRVRRINWCDARKALAPVFAQERDASSPRPTKPTTSSASPASHPLPPPNTPTPSTRGFLLERQSFAELGGGHNGSGAVRLVDLKRMLRSFHVEANFDECVGRSIDMERTGWINFEEFLWVLEYGVRGEGPAADIHAHLTAPLNESAASSHSPQRPRSRTPNSHQRGKNNPQHTTSMNTSYSHNGSTDLSGRRRRQSRRSNRNVRLPSVRSGSARRREKKAGRPATARGNLGAVEEIRREFLARIVKLSPYAATPEPLRRQIQQTHDHSGKLQPHPPRRRSRRRSSHSRGRRGTSRAKSAGARAFSGDGFDKKASTPQRDAAARKLQILRERQARLTKKLQSLTALPLSDQEGRQRSEELHCVQEELNTVLDHIASTLRDLSAAGESGDCEGQHSTDKRDSKV
ncbi:uncharacterized protein TM35_000022860 [Trypanosoma theileri]|uniref:EF-hand domain-containing protein n=1 Tax=Trypanosoma theileri TaxID=67003 RepID=A0A1X0P923_9TRYP|nr:uncharacterized protein TM35_000022860 [Trypanosoma theileri]ORC92960.1 hypothetical protein TM35_000022860 [Trypanosoma theileri]